MSEHPLNLLQPMSIGGGGHNARALLREVEQLLKRLIDEGERSSIDLRSLPLDDVDLELLAEVLGEGEVSARVESLGGSDVRETEIACVWRVTHFDVDGDVMADFIEVTDCPEILCSSVEDAQEGLQALRARLFDAER